MSEVGLQMINIEKSFPGVHALKNVNLEAYVGEALALIGANGAGKSTLMNVLGGIVRPDSGHIHIHGQAVTIRDPLEAKICGISFVHQEMAMLPTLTIAENLFISGFPTRGGMIDFRTANQKSAAVLARLGCTFPPTTRVSHLSAGDRQMVEIARALLSDPKVIIFDEPTSSLTRREKARLFEVISTLKAEGVTVIYITHFLDEVFSLCERAVVLRNGEVVGGGLIKDLGYQDIVQMMIGSKDVANYFGHKQAKAGEPALRVEGLTIKGVLQDISFEIRQGEVLGLWGLLGSGRSELLRAVTGLLPIDAGKIFVRDGGAMRQIQPQQAKNWIGIVTEDRRDDGLLLPMSAKANISLANLRGLVGRVWPLIDTRTETTLAKQYVDRLGIKVSGLHQTVATLSGGNQQKVVVARWLERNPSIYFMDEPTRGLDVGAKGEIRTIIADLAAQGAAILMVSSEIEEIMSVSDRYLVMHRGRIASELPGQATKDELIAAAAGGNA